MPVRIPKYRLHKASGQALVQVAGRRIYLGPHGSPRSEQKYKRIVATLLAGDRLPQVDEAESGRLTIDDLILAYYRWAERYYRKDGRPTDELAALRAALGRLRSLYGTTPADEFGAKRFKLTRESMIQEGLSRKYINDSMARIRRMFRWAASEELLPVAVFQSLATVGGLRRGRSEARETDPVKPVADEAVEATLKELGPVVAAMVRLQRLCGCRPHEVCQMRPVDIDRSAEVWAYRPARHKAEHHGRGRVIFLGPRAQALLRPFLGRPQDAYCFSPGQSVEARYERPEGQLTGHRLASRKPGRPPRDHYDQSSYRRAIRRAAERAGVTPWTPNQLRHSAGTRIRAEYGLEASQNVLGHASADVTQIYAERDEAKARAVMAGLGDDVGRGERRSTARLRMMAVLTDQRD